jgi:hypothetical protein
MTNDVAFESRRNLWVAVPAAIATILLICAGIFSELAPLVVFDSRSTGAYESYRDAAPVLLGIALITANVCIWSLLAPWIRNDSRPRRRTARLVGSVIGMIVGTAVVAAIFAYVVVIIAFSTTDWFTF